MLDDNKNIANDPELLDALENLRKGSAEAFHLLYNKYHHNIYRFCLKMLGDTAMAKDAFQEVFIKVYENRKSFHGSNFSSWLYTIARNTCINAIRNKKGHESFDEIYHGEMRAPDGDIAMKDFIDNAIESLPVTLRESLILREYEDCSYHEIAEILDIDLSLAKVRVHRARLLLRKLLTPLVKELNES